MPAELKSVRFSISYRGRWLDVELDSRRIRIYGQDGRGNRV
ncbi:MAG: hypothetical protein M0Z32_02750 [Actinomycetota bacterium]|nr:hypothetical protein [Actinomycetota bacterium]